LGYLGRKGTVKEGISRKKALKKNDGAVAKASTVAGEGRGNGRVRLAKKQEIKKNFRRGSSRKGREKRPTLKLPISVFQFAVRGKESFGKKKKLGVEIGRRGRTPNLKSQERSKGSCVGKRGGAEEKKLSGTPRVQNAGENSSKSKLHCRNEDSKKVRQKGR